MQKKQQDVQKKTIRCTKKEKKTVYWDLINSNVNKRDVQTGCSWYCTWSSNDENVMIFTVDNGSCE